MYTMPATTAQIKYLRKLTADNANLRGLNPSVMQKPSVIAWIETSSKEQASNRIANLLKKNSELRNMKASVSAESQIAEGFYTLEGDVYKVQRAVHGSGNLYAKVMNIASGTFEYVPGAIKRLQSRSEAHKLDKKTAADYGILYGKCMICQRTLTDEQSIKQGIGPICLSKMGW